MSHDSSSSAEESGSAASKQRGAWVRPLIGYALWIAVSFVAAYVLLYATLWLITRATGPITHYMSENLAQTLAGFLLYGYMLAVLILIPRKVIGERINKQTLGIAVWPGFRTLPVAIVGIFAYFVAAAILMQLATKLLPWFNAGQAQNVGINAPVPGFETWLTLMLLVIVGPIVEELIFRGYLYGNLKRVGVPVWLAIFVTSALFGAAHLQWNVGINVFALSVMMCLAREYTGSIWAGVLMHMMKNALAFYLLFGTL